MRFIDLYDHAARKMDYDPEVDEYKEDVRKVVNDDVYLPLFADRLWTFAQREVEIVAYADDSATDGITTNNSTSIQTATAFFLDWMEGQVLEIAGVEYEIAVVNTTTQAYLTTAYLGMSDTGVALTAKHRYVDMPTDCTKLLFVKDYTNDTVYYEYSRYESDVLVLDPDETGQSEAWFHAEPAYVQGPPVPPVLSVAAGGFTVTPGTYEVAYGFVYQNRRGPLSAAVEQVVAAGEKLSITLPNTVANSGYLKSVWVRFGSWAAYRLVVDDLDEVVTTYEMLVPVETGWLTAERAPEHDGYHERVRLYYRQSSDTTLTLRYQYQPPRLIEDEDAPRFPRAYHSYLVQATLAELYRQGDDLPSSRLSELKAEAVLGRMRARFLTPETRTWTKGNFDGAWTERARRRTFVHLP